MLTFSTIASSAAGFSLVSPSPGIPHQISSHLTILDLTTPPLTTPHLSSPHHTTPSNTTPHLTTPHLMLLFLR